MTKKPIKIIFTIFISIALLSILTIFYSKSFESENSITTHPQNDVYLKINGKIHSTQFVTSDTVESFMQRLMNEKKNKL